MDANTDDEAITKILAAGAVSCRNMASLKACDEEHRHMPVLDEEQLREIVRFSMESESLAPLPVRQREETTDRLKGSPYSTGVV
ncbi:MAG: hypothetical protein IH628_02255 [Proteobacteria bacterium]|nr:hypothetical protein [Pseudomonadota bacterium]